MLGVDSGRSQGMLESMKGVCCGREARLHTELNFCFRSSVYRFASLHLSCPTV